MRFRKRIFQVILLSGVICWFFSGWFLTLIFVFANDDIVFLLEQEGHDVSACKQHMLSALSPAAGLPDCLARNFRDVDRKFEQTLQQTEQMDEEHEGESHD
jgi:hypothetical protein